MSSQFARSSDLLERVAAPHARQAGGTRLVLIMAAICALLFLALAGTVFAVAWNRDLILVDARSRALEQMAYGLFYPLKSGHIEAALAVCADGPDGQRLLREAEQAAFGAAAPEPAAADAPTCLGALQTFRAQLSELGVDWTLAAPVAIAGVEAQVFEPGLMDQPLTAFTGDLYLESGGRMYALNLSARRSSNAYIVTDLWSVKALPVAPGGLEPHAQAHYPAIGQELAGITGVHFIFKRLNPPLRSQPGTA